MKLWLNIWIHRNNKIRKRIVNAISATVAKYYTNSIAETMVHLNATDSTDSNFRNKQHRLCISSSNLKSVETRYQTHKTFNTLSLPHATHSVHCALHSHHTHTHDIWCMVQSLHNRHSMHNALLPHTTHSVHHTLATQKTFNAHCTWQAAFPPVNLCNLHFIPREATLQVGPYMLTRLHRQTRRRETWFKGTLQKYRCHHFTQDHFHSVSN